MPAPMRRAAPLLPLLLGAVLAACGGDEPPEDLRAAVRPLQPATEAGDAHHFAVERIAGGLNRPTYVGAAPGDRGRLWVLEQPGRVVRVSGDRRRTVLDLTGQVRTGSEKGLLGMAFHPDFATNRRLYLHWTNREGDTRVAEFRARRDGTIDPRPLRELLRSSSRRRTTRAVSSRSGPTAGSTSGSATAAGRSTRASGAGPAQQLGKVLAVDVEAPRPRWAVVLSGLRNPWRFSFDPALGEIWVGDVGQDEVEEINRVLLEPDEPPKNLGWSAFEGTGRVERRGGSTRAATSSGPSRPTTTPTGAR